MNALTMGRIHHAYLFTGARGIGKTTVARILAKALNCEKGTTAEPCGTCRACTEIIEGSSLDVQEIDGASNTGVDDVREIREKVRYLPSSGRYKIYIIDEVHMLSTSAFNALLKTLEEPPPHVVFIFATTESHKIPATILSRCQRYDFRRITSGSIAQSLGRVAQSEGISVEDDALALIAREASGSLRDGQSLLDQAIAFGGKKITVKTLQDLLGFLDRTQLMSLLDAVLERDAGKSLALLGEIYQMGSDLNQFAVGLLEILRHLLVIKAAGGAPLDIDIPKGERERLSAVADSLNIEDIERMFQIWYRGTERISRSPFPKMLAEVFIVRLCNLTPVANIADIVARIDEISEGSPERSLRQAPVAKASEVKQEGATWESFMRWLMGERPQVASVLNHGKLVGMEGDALKVEFDAPLYAEMVLEQDRRAQIDELLAKHFGHPMKLEVSTCNTRANGKDSVRSKQRATKEALESTLVRQAAEIFDARVHEVKTKG
jgi:DNA polymerase-3 subunit gamma/tau